MLSSEPGKSEKRPLPERIALYIAKNVRPYWEGREANDELQDAVTVAEVWKEFPVGRLELEEAFQVMVGFGWIDPVRKGGRLDKDLVVRLTRTGAEDVLSLEEGSRENTSITIRIEEDGERGFEFMRSAVVEPQELRNEMGWGGVNISLLVMLDCMKPGDTWREKELQQRFERGIRIGMLRRGGGGEKAVEMRSLRKASKLLAKSVSGVVRERRGRSCCVRIVEALEIRYVDAEHEPLHSPAVRDFVRSELNLYSPSNCEDGDAGSPATREELRDHHGAMMDEVHE